MATTPSSISVSRVPGQPTQIAVSWGASSPAFPGRTVSYRLERSTNGGGYVTVITSTTVRSTTRTEAAGNFYRYRVAALESGVADSAYRVSDSITLPPATPGSITLSRSSNLDQINISWSSSNGATGYDLQRQEGSGSFTNQLLNYAPTSANIGALNRGSTYTFRVRAKNSGGDSAYRESSSLTLVPFRPESVSASLSGDTSIRVTWPAANGATSYRVQRSENGGAYSNLETTSSRDRTYSLNRGSTYTFTVWSINGGGESPTSRDSNSVLIPLPPPNPPPSVTAAAPVGRSIGVSWEAASGGAGVSNYDVERIENNTSWVRILSSTTSLSLTSSSLNPRSTYRFRVRANGPSGSSGFRESNSQTIAPATLPPVTTATRTLRSVTVTMTEPTVLDQSIIITGYTTQRKQGSGDWGDTKTTTDLDNRSITYTDLPSETNQQFRGRADTNLGSSDFFESQVLFIPGLPDAPSQLFALREGASVRVIAAAPASDGGAPVLTYTIEKRISDNLGVTWSEWENPLVINFSEPFYLYENLELQKTYQFRALATNEEGNSENFTESESVYLPAIMRIYDNNQFRLPNNYKRYNEEIGDWVGLGISRRYFNGQWFELE
jgi:fibronectin type 3 domain-containing protein